jgi:hypothetical protein
MSASLTITAPATVRQKPVIAGMGGLRRVSGRDSAIASGAAANPVKDVRRTTPQ